MGMEGHLTRWRVMLKQNKKTKTAAIKSGRSVGNDKSTLKKRGPGRPGFEPTDNERKQVEALSGYGVPQDKIANLIRDGIDKVTLLKHFRAELDRGLAKADAKIAETLFQQAVGGNISALIFWAKSRMGWSEKTHVDVTTNGESINAIDRAAALAAVSGVKPD